jgi:hypothetical protein
VKPTGRNLSRIGPEMIHFGLLSLSSLYAAQGAVAFLLNYISWHDASRYTRPFHLSAIGAVERSTMATESSSANVHRPSACFCVCVCAKRYLGILSHLGVDADDNKRPNSAAIFPPFIQLNSVWLISIYLTERHAQRVQCPDRQQEQTFRCELVV